MLFYLSLCILLFSHVSYIVFRFFVSSLSPSLCSFVLVHHAVSLLSSALSTMSRSSLHPLPFLPLSPTILDCQLDPTYQLVVNLEHEDAYAYLGPAHREWRQACREHGRYRARDHKGRFARDADAQEAINRMANFVATRNISPGFCWLVRVDDPVVRGYINLP